MTMAQASRYHQDKLNVNLDDLANRSINPTRRSVTYLHDSWRAKYHGSVGGESMLSSIKRYAEANTSSKIGIGMHGDHFVVVLVTEFMLRVHEQLREASEVVLVDTTSRVDQSSTAVMPLLCAGPAGALPLGVMFASSQDEKSYATGFNLLMNMVGQRAFFGQGHPSCFITDDSEAQRNAIKTVWPRSERFLSVFHVLRQTWRWLCDGAHGVKKEHRPTLMTAAKQMVCAESEANFQESWNAFSQSPEAQHYDQYTR
ncbi:hypothetical protein GWK47_052130 [Chionoecetes opilio]|uniref:MULE transposase domain-containing protein n=1 Tax=Chionoecetes opilio TaxID=41210 RepID=A0A8J5CQA3_CHIOP|nr:hypothetical protein GWK47_052130 [Chionoecetes opilio]